MGYALAEAALELGAETVLITGPTGLTPPAGAQVIRFETTAELHRAVLAELEAADGLIMAAAPADFRPRKTGKSKIKRGSDTLALELEPTEDILKDVARHRKKGQVIVGFALETNDGEANARRKLEEKQLDLIILNTVGDATGFNTDTNQVTIISPDEPPKSLPLLTKRVVGVKILQHMAKLF